MKIINIFEQDLNHRLTEAVCPSLITNYFLPGLMFEEIFLYSRIARYHSAHVRRSTHYLQTLTAFMNLSFRIDS